MASQPQSVTEEVLLALKNATAPLRVAQLLELCGSAPDTTTIAAACHAMVKAHRIVRTGDAGKYAYTMPGKADLSPPTPKPSADAPTAEAERPAAAVVMPAEPAATQKRRSPQAIATRREKKAPPASHREADDVQYAIDVFIATPDSMREPRDINESRARLAALVIAYWPAAIDRIPPSLAKALDASFTALRGGA